MGMLSRLSTTVAPARVRGESIGAAATKAFWSGGYVPPFWLDSLSAVGVQVSPELAMTLSHVYCAVSSISDDFATMTCQLFKELPGGDKERVRPRDPGIGALAYRLQWQPNFWQSASEFWGTLSMQYLLRKAAYAEIVPGPTGFADQIIPRHPDRVEQEVAHDPGTGRPFLRYLIHEPSGVKRPVLQEQMFVVRNTSTDGLNAISRTEYASRSLTTMMALQEFTRHYFKNGATASTIATYKGTRADDDWEKALHASIANYLSGVENAGGVLIVPEDIDIRALGVHPKDAEMPALQNLSGRDVARFFKMPPSWLGIDGTSSGYGSQIQDAQNYINRCQMPKVVRFEQSIKRDLIIVKDAFFAKFNMDYFLRGDFKSRMEGYEIGIRSRVIRPSEARTREDMNPDKELDKLSEGDNRPGMPANSAGARQRDDEDARAFQARVQVKGLFALRDGAERCLRRQRAAVAKLAAKHAKSAAAFNQAVAEFFDTDFVPFVANTMRISPAEAEAYANDHLSALLKDGAASVHSDAWERAETDELCALALGVAA